MRHLVIATHLTGTAALLLAACADVPSPEVAQGNPAASTPAAADSSWQWVYVPDRYQYTYGAGVVADVGGAYITGSYDRGFYGDGPDPLWGDHGFVLRGEVNFFIARIGADGSPRWARHYGDDGRVSASGLARGPDGSLYIVGTMWPNIASVGDARWVVDGRPLIASKQSAFVARLDTAGSVRWARLIEGAGDVSEVVVDAVGRVYVSGSTGVPPPLGESGHAYLAAFAANGEPQWFRIVAQGTYSMAEGVAVTPYGVCVVGNASMPEDSTERTGEPNQLQHGFAAGFSHAGKRLWGHAVTARQRDPARPARAGGIGPQSISVLLYGAAVDRSGACYAAGGFAGDLDFGTTVLTSEYDLAEVNYGFTDAVILKYDSRGRAQWGTRGIGGPYSDWVDAIAVTPEGRLVVVGRFMGAGDFGAFRLAVPTPNPRVSSGRYIGQPRGLFAALLSSDGDVLLVVQNLPEEKGLPTAVAVSPDGSVYLTGTQERSATYGRIVAPNLGINAFLARLSGF